MEGYGRGLEGLGKEAKKPLTFLTYVTPQDPKVGVGWEGVIGNWAWGGWGR